MKGVRWVSWRYFFLYIIRFILGLGLRVCMCLLNDVVNIDG